jgi:hypothetical protein
LIVKQGGDLELEGRDLMREAGKQWWLQGGNEEDSEAIQELIREAGR